MDIGEIGARVTELTPVIRARRREIEEARQLPGDLAEAMQRSGLFALSVPRDLGGAQAEPADLMRTIERVAAADGSTGWCAMVGIANNVVAGYMEPAGAAEIFADPTLPTAGIAAPAGAAVREQSGVRVTGRWPFASGVTHCRWVWAGCMVMEGGQPRMTAAGPEMVHACIPADQITVHDTWHVSGLVGTGSHDFSAEGVFVPDRHVFALLDPAGHRRDPLYQMPPLGLFVYQLAAVSLGIARAALDELTELAHTKTPTLYMEPLAERPAAQIGLARAEVALGAARAYLFQAVDDLWRTVAAGGPPSARQQALARGACTHAVETAAAVAAGANRLAGGSAIYRESPFQRHARDAEAVTHHFTVAPFTWEQAGRLLLGRPPGVPVV
jgi:alkylation response protein AidB-like acyl-CoA dehydrogenase